jgi:hypothetical protein
MVGAEGAGKTRNDASCTVAPVGSRSLRSCFDSICCLLTQFAAAGDVAEADTRAMSMFLASATLWKARLCITFC